MTSSPLSTLVSRVQSLLGWWNASRPGRALARYGQANGGLLCGGIAYSAIFSLFAGLTIGYTVFMSSLGSNAELRSSVLESVNTALPGLIAIDGGEGMVNPDELVLDTSINLASIIAAVVLLFSAISCMGAIRSSVRVMFALPPGGGNALLAKARQLGGFATVGLALVVSAVLGIAVNAATGWFLDLLGLGSAGRVLLPIAAFAVSFAVDMGVFALVVVLLAGVRPPRRDLLLGALLAAAGFGIVRFLGTSVVAGGADTNPVVASFVVIVTLLIWINLSARIILTAAAFTANLPLEMITRLSDEDAAREVVEAARAGHDVVAQDPAPQATPAAQRPSAAARAVPLVVAAVGGFVLGRRGRPDA